MSGIRSLRIKLGTAHVGSLFAVDDGRVYFRFDESYAINPDRPVLSISFMGGSEGETQAQLLNPALASTVGSGNGRLPVYFRNLLPEGVLRRHLVSIAGLDPQDEVGLLSFCGEDLPGDVWAVREELNDPALGRLVTQGRDSYEMSSHQLPTPEAVSLSGVQPKVSLMEAPGGRYVMRSKNNTGKHFIGKLPASDYFGLPEVEYTSLDLARAAGVNTCQADLLPLTAISDQLPFSLRDDARNFLLVHRFDRDLDTETGRMHTEDFAQVLELAPEDKYSGSYAAIGLVLLHASSAAEEDVLELLRRIKVNELLGNFDGHVKNYGLLYTGQGPRLSPAYDVVAYAAYAGGNGHALKLHPDEAKRELTPSVLRRLANTWEIAETRLKEVLVTTVDRAMRTWPDLIEESPMAPSQKAKLREHLEKNSSAQAWRRRHP